MATLWLVGMMGSGKSTVAPLVAAATGREWFDTDTEVATRSGVTVADLIATDEATFREAERAVVGSLAGRDAVVACGGGVVTDPDTVREMRDSGFVVLLDAPLDTLAARVGTGEGRPLLTGEVGGSLGRIASERQDLYRAAADAVVDAAGTPEQVADRVVMAWTRSS